MDYLEIDIANNKNINVSLKCTECGTRFNSELDIKSDSGSILKRNEIIYCFDCEEPHEFETVTQNQKLKVKFLDDNLLPKLNYSSSIDYREDDRIPYDYIRALRFYKTQIQRLRQLLEVKYSERSIIQTSHRLIYSGVITSLETYINEVLLFMVLESDIRFRQFVENYEPYKKESFKLNQVLEKSDIIFNKVKYDLNKLVYHSVPRIIKIFDIYEFDLAAFDKIDLLTKSILKRHDLIHRSGIDIDDNLIEVTSYEINDLIKITDSFVEYINTKTEEYLYNPYELPF